MIDTQTDLLALGQEAVETARKKGADAAEAFVSFGRSRNAVLEKDDLTLARQTEELSVGVRVIVNQALAFVTTNDPSGLERAIEQAIAVARMSPPDPNLALPEPGPVSNPQGIHDPAIAELSAEQVAEIAVQMGRQVAERDRRVSIDRIEVSVAEGEEAIASSTGIAARSRQTVGSAFAMGMALEDGEVGSFSYDGEYANRLDILRDRLGPSVDRFVDKCVGALKPQKGVSFKGLIVLTPETVGELLVEPVMEALFADAVRKGRSPLAGKLGEVVASSSLSLRDPGPSLGHFGTRGFDREGQPRRALELVQGGVVQSYMYDSYEARLAGVRSTGHAQGGATGLPRIGGNLVEVLGGTEHSERLLAGLDRALIVPRFAGRVESVSGDMSGSVKGGFMLENGQLRPVSEMMIAGNVFDMLKQIVAVSADRHQLWGSSLLPTIVIDGVSVTAG